MNEAFGSALWISLIGMGLVFIAILLLWGLMELVVRLTADRGEAKKEALEPEVGAPAVVAPPAENKSLKLRAAAAAVAYALSAKQSSASSPYATPPAASGSAWQAVMRSYQLNLRGQMGARKSRGNKS